MYHCRRAEPPSRMVLKILTSYFTQDKLRAWARALVSRARMSDVVGQLMDACSEAQLHESTTCGLKANLAPAQRLGYKP
ncbi:hypothetical protein V6N13_124135 [Hibiscus sabdariffa]|uniref:Uncharacterized protein n=1 Tax=Hibiscus sabdariffa TaxID=183260 RepID=A0ABR2S1C1_9ROSI